MKSIWNEKLDEVLSATASNEPVPGGGSVAVITACLGIALMEMALGVIAKRSSVEKVESIREQLTSTRAKLQGFADQDMIAFSEIIKALALAQESEDEKLRRKDALAKAAIQATDIPIKAGELMLTGLQLGAGAKELVAGHVLNDLLAGLKLVQTSLQICLANVDANTALIQDRALAEKLLAQKEKLLAEAAQF